VFRRDVDGNIELIKKLRAKTGAGLLDCKKAIEEAGTIDGAIENLRIRGIYRADNRSSKATCEGIVYPYIHTGNKIGVLLEINCETDFVAMNAKFTQLARDIAMHIAAASPRWVSREEVPEDAQDKERQILLTTAIREGKSERIATKIVEGRMRKFYESNCLMEQFFIKDDTKTVADRIREVILSTGENIQIKRFTRFVVGEDKMDL